MPLHLTADAFRHLGHELVDRIAAFLDHRPGLPVTPNPAPEALRALLGADGPMPEHGADAGTLLGEAFDLLTGHSLLNGHPRFFGYVTASPAPIGMLADLLAAAVNPNVGAWILSPAASEVEGQAVRWIADLLGCGPGWGGLFTSGGNMANIIPLLAARTRAASWDVQQAGMAATDASPLRVYASAETHTWVQKGCEIAGLGAEAIHWIAVNGDQRLDMAALRAAIAADRRAGRTPMMVVGSAGTVSTGAVDPLDEIATLCATERIWFHVDGAYGAPAVAVPGTPAALGAMARADSIAVDPHKWLYAPLEAGCTLVRDVETLRRTFSHHPPYYHFGTEATNYVDLGPQNSRGFRALKVWLQLRHAGRAGYVRMIGDDIRLSERLHAAIAAHPALEAVTQGLSITTFRYVPAELRATVGTPDTERTLNALNTALLDRLQASGRAFVSNAVVNGRFLLRACIVNINTTAADVDALPDIVAELGEAVRAEQ